MQASTREDSKVSGADSKMKESMKLQVVFDIDNSVVHDICAAESYQQTTSATRAICIFVVEITIMFWESEAS